MKIELYQISSLEKVMSSGAQDFKQIKKRTALGGERVFYQIAVKSDESALLYVNAKATLQGGLKTYIVQEVIVDLPAYEAERRDDDYLTYEPGLMPDLLMPAADTANSLWLQQGKLRTVWISLDISHYCAAGSYSVAVEFRNGSGDIMTTAVMEIEVIGAKLSMSDLIYTQWFYADCIADAHDVAIYSEKHWDLIDKYMKAAYETGVNMLLVPVFTPPLDTAFGITRPCVQLVDISMNNKKYEFCFDRMHRWITMAKECGMTFFEISHLFSQWGAKYSPNIMGTVDGERKYIFGWEVEADSEEYRDFLVEFLPRLVNELDTAGVIENTYFHISDEPALENIEQYRYAHNLIKSAGANIKTMDALSNYEFYRSGLVDCPVTAIDHLEEFLRNDIPRQWAYYCGGQTNKVSNRFIAMPSYRNRILGIQMYKYDIKGFLHWGFNYYNTFCSRYKINPYLTTSGDGVYPSGDTFSVYPGKNGPYLSLRALVFFEALQDFAICKLLESFIGKEEVVAMIEALAGMEITMENYPRNTEFLLSLRKNMELKIKDLYAG